MAKVLVTGANGFIGSNLCRYLLAHSHKVSGLVRRASDRHSLNKIRGLKLFEGDITDRDSLEAAVAQTEVVYHLAGYVSDWGPWSAFYAGNVLGVANIMEAARAAGVRRVVHLSSVSVYGFPEGVDNAARGSQHAYGHIAATRGGDGRLRRDARRRMNAWNSADADNLLQIKNHAARPRYHFTEKCTLAPISACCAKNGRLLKPAFQEARRGGLRVESS